MDSFEERLKSQTRAFEGLLSIIPAKQYYGGEDTSDQWKRKKQTKEEARTAKLAKLDPDNHKSAKEVYEEQQAEQKKRKRDDAEKDGLSDKPDLERSVGGDNDYQDNLERPLDSLAKKGKKTKKQKREEKGDVSALRESGSNPAREARKITKKETDKAEGMDTDKASKGERKKANKDAKRAKEAAKLEKNLLKKAKQEEAAVLANANGIKSNLDHANDEIEDVAMGDGDFEGLVDEVDAQRAHDESDSNESSRGGSVIFDGAATTGSGSSSISTPPLMTSTVDEAVEGEPKKETAGKKSGKSKIKAGLNDGDAQKKATVISSAEPTTSTVPNEALRQRFQARIEALRASRKASGTNGQPIRSRQDLLDQRRRREEARKTARKAQRRQARDDLAREKAELLATGSPLFAPSPRPGSPNSATDPTPPTSSLSFSRIDLPDTTRSTSDSTTTIGKKRKGSTDPRTALLSIEAKRARLASLPLAQQAKIAESDSWQAARARTERPVGGTKSLALALASVGTPGSGASSSETLLKKALKRKEKAKKKSGREWDERIASVEKAREAKQKRRDANLTARREGGKKASGAGANKGKGKPKGKDKDRGKNRDRDRDRAKGAGKKEKRAGFEGSFKSRPAHGGKKGKA